MILNNEEINLLVELISNEQIHRHKKHPDFYCDNKYKQLEELKIKIKQCKDN